MTRKKSKSMIYYQSRTESLHIRHDAVDGLDVEVDFSGHFQRFLRRKKQNLSSKTTTLDQKLREKTFGGFGIVKGMETWFCSRAFSTLAAAGPFARASAPRTWSNLMALVVSWK